VTWNINGKIPNPETRKDLTIKLFNFGKFGNFSIFLLIPLDPPDIIAVGLQEMVNLSAKNVVFTNNDKVTNDWRKLLEESLAPIGQY